MPDSGRKDLIPMKRPLAYITAPWSENEFENTENAAKYCRAVYDAGFSPVCPALFLPLFLRDEIPQEHKDCIDMAREYTAYVCNICSYKSFDCFWCACFDFSDSRSYISNTNHAQQTRSKNTRMII